MQKLYSIIIRLPVISFQSEDVIAVCKVFYFSPEDFTCKVIAVSGKELFQKEVKYIVFTDVLEISNGIYIQDHDILIEEEELVRFKDTIKKNCVFKGMEVQTVKGEKIGFVYDFSLDIDTGLLETIHVAKGSFFTRDKRIIARTQIVKIKNNVIIVDNLLLNGKRIEDSLKKVAAFEAEPSLTIHQTRDDNF